MGRIIFLNPFSKSEISGGIKTVYRHAEMLGELGFRVHVYNPEGPPSWFETCAITQRALAPVAGDVLVFPDTLNGPLMQLAQAESAARKIMFCQNQYYMALNPLAPESLVQLGFSAFLCSSVSVRNFLASVFHVSDAPLIPCHVDPGIFFPREKSAQIACVPRKMPREARLLRAIFQAKYPQHLALLWKVIEDTTECEMAGILGRSSIFLSLSFFESLGLVPLEAMASGCIVAGFDGYGGREYATPANGCWFAPDHLEELADALAAIADGLERGDPAIAAMRKTGADTAARYSKERTREALREVYGRLMR